MLANLDNGTIFKKAFTDKLVFEQFIEYVLKIKQELENEQNKL